MVAHAVCASQSAHSGGLPRGFDHFLKVHADSPNSLPGNFVRVAVRSTGIGGAGDDGAYPAAFVALGHQTWSAIIEEAAGRPSSDRDQ